MTAANIARRLAALEQQLRPATCAADRERAAAEFTARIMALVERFTDDEAGTPEADRLTRYSPAMRLAWTLRFERDAAKVEAMLDEVRTFAWRGEAAA